MARSIPWSRDQRLVAFRLYCRTPFGRLHQHNPEIVELAKAIGRTPAAVAMKTCNFASLDPVQHARNVVGLGNVSAQDEALWIEFQTDAETVAAEAEEAYSRLTGRDLPPLETDLVLPQGPTEIIRAVRTRRVQAFFRAAVLASYDYRCALSNVAVLDLLNASHIVPWNADISRRADPRNGIALNVLYDRAFDRGLIAFDESSRVLVATVLKSTNPPTFHRQALLEMEGQQLRLPCRFAPDPAAMAYHREHIFRG